MEEKPLRKYVVMVRYYDNDSFNLEKSFVERQDADDFVRILKRTESNHHKYYLFEQSKDYQHTEQV